jgi:hypothetical protein
MTDQPFAEVLDFVMTHDGCGEISLELDVADVYTLRCVCGSVIERPIPGPDARYHVIFRALAVLSEN